ncbi:hypothetical protein GGR56DRAFT_388214 [Xylariaceae sp. FL0804]|nr:hypothetical protein GGR56DRAFT_388214 [Xylariaceae sp. FL0804]
MSVSGWVVYLWNLRFLPLHVRWPILKWRRKILHPVSPLGLRFTWRMARRLRPPQHPSSVITRLLWPWDGWRWHWRWSAVLPAAPSDLEPEELIRRGTDMMSLRLMPLFRWRDTPQRCLYRMYEAVVADCYPLLQYEVEYFWRHADRRWATANLYDPAQDCVPGPIDAERHAILAAIVEELVDSFHWRLDLGLRRLDPASLDDYEKMPLIPETAPAWPSIVPPLPELLPLQLCLEEDMAERESKKGNAFLRRNIFAFAGEFYTI